MLAKADLQEASCVLAKIPSLGTHVSMRGINKVHSSRHNAYDVHHAACRMPIRLSDMSRKPRTVDSFCFNAHSYLSSRGSLPI